MTPFNLLIIIVAIQQWKCYIFKAYPVAVVSWIWSLRIIILGINLWWAWKTCFIFRLDLLYEIAVWMIKYCKTILCTQKDCKKCSSFHCQFYNLSRPQFHTDVKQCWLVCYQKCIFVDKKSYIIVWNKRLTQEILIIKSFSITLMMESEYFHFKDYSKINTILSVYRN